PADASLMAGMWELPEIPRPGDHENPIFKVRHSITVTDYVVSVWRTAVAQGGNPAALTDAVLALHVHTMRMCKEEVANSVTHGFGLALSLAGLVLLIV